MESVSAPVPLPLAMAEVLGLPAWLLTRLPLATTLVCRFSSGEPGRVMLVTRQSNSGEEGARLSDPPVFAFLGPEVDALALAAEHDRATHAMLRAWCAKKPEWRLTSVEALGRLGYRPQWLGWSTGRVLGALGLRLDEVWL